MNGFPPGGHRSSSRAVPSQASCRKHSARILRLPDRSVARTWWWGLLNKKSVRANKQPELVSIRHKRYPIIGSQKTTNFRTLFTRADVEQARAEAVSRGHAEACVGRVHALIGKHLTGEDEAIPGDPFHAHIILIHRIQRPLKQKRHDCSFSAANWDFCKA